MSMTLYRIISGFQTGADIAGIRAAVDLGLETGGAMPKGFLTEDGPKPEYADLYGAREHASASYPPRTRQNVADSDTTVIFAPQAGSRGTRLTVRTCQDAGKPFLLNPDRAALIAFLIDHAVEVLNVAGNSVSKAPGIERMVYRFLTSSLREHLS